MTNKPQITKFKTSNYSSNEVDLPAGKAGKYILYVDTSDTEAVIALYRDSKKIAEERWQPGRELSKTLSQKHSDILACPELGRRAKVGMSSKDLDGICVFIGPGSFTGLRIGISFANGLAFGLGIPIYETKVRGKINLKNPKQIAIPHYGSSPKITKLKARK